MSEVIDIRPDTSAKRLITPHWIECRIEEFMRECDLVGVPVVMSLFIEGVAHPRLNHTAIDNPHVMCGAIEEAKNVLLGVGPIMLIEALDEEEPTA